MKKSLKLLVSGKVRDVGLREHIQKEAERLGIVGSVQHSANGTLLIVAIGEADNLELLIDAIYDGTKKSAVENIEIESFQPHASMRGIFRIIGEENEEIAE